MLVYFELTSVFSELMKYWSSRTVSSFGNWAVKATLTYSPKCGGNEGMGSEEHGNYGLQCRGDSSDIYHQAEAHWGLTALLCHTDVCVRCLLFSWNRTRHMDKISAVQILAQFKELFLQSALYEIATECLW